MYAEKFSPVGYIIKTMVKDHNLFNGEMTHLTHQLMREMMNMKVLFKKDRVPKRGQAL